MLEPVEDAEPARTSRRWPGRPRSELTPEEEEQEEQEEDAELRHDEGYVGDLRERPDRRDRPG